MKRSPITWTPLGILAAAVAVCLFVPSDRALAANSPNVSIGQVTTYRTAESVSVAVASSSGDICQLSNPAAGTKIGRVKRIKVFKPAGAFVLTIEKRSTLNAGGTPTTPTAVPMDSSSGAATLSCVGYTAKPTAGTPVGTIEPPVSVAVTDMLVFDFGTEDRESLTLRPGQALALWTDTARVISYSIEWTEAAH